MQAVAASSSCLPELHSFVSQEGYAGVIRTNLLSVSSRRSTDISLMTAEGDKVTISAQSAFQAGLVSYDYRGRLNSHEVSLQGGTLQVASENSLAIAVEGDLSQEERSEIKKLVAKLEKLGADFFSQPLGDSLVETLDVGDFASIAGFAARMSDEQQVTVAQQLKEEFATPGDSSPAAPEQIAVSSSLNASAAASSAFSAPEAEGADAQVIFADSVRKFVNTVLDAIKDIKLDGEKITEKASRLLAQLFKKLSKELRFDEARQKLADHIHDTLQTLLAR